MKEDKCDVCGEIIQPSFEVFRYSDYAFCSQECTQKFSDIDESELEK